MDTKFGALTQLLGKTDIKGSLFDPNKVKKNKQRRYNHLMRGINIYSHSTSEKLVLCERKFACSKLEQNQPIQIDDIETISGNMDFAFGKAIETGVQSALLNNSRQKIFFDMFMAWDMNLMAVHPKGAEKTFTDSVIAIDQFLYIRDQIMDGWEIAMFRGKPAIELAMLIDLENGYYYVGHADLILYHPSLKQFRVLEIKTTGAKTLHEAMYKNSGQATGYSVFLDEIARDYEELTSTFEVYYLVYPTGLGHWKLFNFTKSRSARAAWLNTVLLDINRVSTYRKVNFFPKRGSSCFDFYRPCQYLDRCDLDPSTFNPTGDFAVITEVELNQHEFDFKFKLSQILETQKELIR